MTESEPERPLTVTERIARDFPEWKTWSIGHRKSSHVIIWIATILFFTFCPRLVDTPIPIWLIPASMVFLSVFYEYMRVAWLEEVDYYIDVLDKKQAAREELRRRKENALR